MKLKAYLEKIGQKPTPWAIEKGLSASTISKIINGKTGLHLDTAIKISEATDGAVSLTELIGSPRVSD